MQGTPSPSSSSQRGLWHLVSCPGHTAPPPGVTRDEEGQRSGVQPLLTAPRLTLSLSGTSAFSEQLLWLALPPTQRSGRQNGRPPPTPGAAPGAQCTHPGPLVAFAPAPAHLQSPTVFPQPRPAGPFLTGTCTAQSHQETQNSPRRPALRCVSQATSGKAYAQEPRLQVSSLQADILSRQEGLVTKPNQTKPTIGVCVGSAGYRGHVPTPGRGPLGAVRPNPGRGHCPCVQGGWPCGADWRGRGVREMLPERQSCWGSELGTH